MKKNNNKGFTLVELIVVLVILAILAAILVPALLGYIDKARNGQYLEEAHSIYTATQAYATEQYAKAPTADMPTSYGPTDDFGKYVAPIVDPTVVESASIKWKGASGTDAKQGHTIDQIEIVFTSQNKTKVKTKFDGSSWSDPVKQ